MIEEREAPPVKVTIDLEQMFQGEVSSEVVRDWAFSQVDQTQYETVMASLEESQRIQARMILEAIFYRLALAWISDHTQTEADRAQTVQLIKTRVVQSDLQAQLRAVLAEISSV